MSHRNSRSSTRSLRNGALASACAALLLGACGGELEEVQGDTEEETLEAAKVPCGLSYSGPVFGQYKYTIRNCHNYDVHRKLDLRRLIIGYPDGPCHLIRARSSIKATTSLPDSVYIAGIKGC